VTKKAEACFAKAMTAAATKSFMVIEYVEWRRAGRRY
jgi:hypothetical protein